MADRSTLRDAVRDTIKEPSTSNLSDDTLNRMVDMATEKLERDLVSEGRPNPRQMIARATITTDSGGVLTLPDDWLRARSVKADDTLYKYASNEKLEDNGELADTDVRLVYYQRLPKLTDSTSNWLLDIAQDLYIYATCFQYAPWNRENGDVYGQYYADGVNGVCLSNSMRPTGGMIQHKRPQYNGFYTIYGNSMVFGRLE